MKGLIVFVLALGLEIDRERPVAKVIKLLKDMQSQLLEEKKADEEAYEKMECWCKVNGEGKTAATEAAGRKLSQLSSLIKELSSREASLDGDISSLTAELAQNKDALATATALRAKEAAEFHGAEKESLVNLEGLKNAIIVLSKHQAFLQGATSASSVISVRKSLAAVFKSPEVEDMMSEILNPTQKQQVSDFVQGGAPQAYQNQSGELTGVLKQLQENMEKNLSEAQKSEVTAVDEFKALKQAKTEEITATSNKLKAKSQHLAKTSEANAEAKQDKADTESTLSADEAFLVDLQQRCASADKEWAVRSQTRSEEIAAVGEAVSILSSDDAHDTFDTTYNFLQMTSSTTTLRQKVALRLRAVAATTGSVALGKIAASVKLDAFSKVKEAMQNMVKDLAKQQSDEVKHKDFCNDEFHKNDGEQFDTQNSIEDLTTSVDALASSIDDHAQEIELIDAATKELVVEQQRANENRQKQNWAFQQTVADQRATQVILKKALDRLQKFYGFVQEKQPAGPPPPAGFAPLEKSAGAGGALTMLKNVMLDAANLEKEAISAEQDAQQAYESFQQETNRALDASARAKTDKVEAKATAAKSKVQAAADRADALQTAQDLSNYKGQLHQSCDFVTANFDDRQEARSQEMDALKSAMSILSGAQ